MTLPSQVPVSRRATLRGFSNKVGTHVTSKVKAAPLIGYASGKPFVYWIASVNWSNKYEVKNFTVKLTYQVLQ